VFQLLLICLIAAVLGLLARLAGQDTKRPYLVTVISVLAAVALRVIAFRSNSGSEGAFLLALVMGCAAAGTLGGEVVSLFRSAGKK